MACRLAGKPVLQRAPRLENQAADDEPEANRKDEAINGAAPGPKKLLFDLSITQNAAGIFGSPRLTKRATEEHRIAKAEKMTAAESAMASKQATVEDVLDAEAPPRGTLEAGPSQAKKHVAALDPATLREHDDGRTKRLKPGAVDEVPLGLRCTTASKPDEQQAKLAPQVGNAIAVAKCSSCLDMHPSRDMLQLLCKGDGHGEYHAYCRDCLKGPCPQLGIHRISLLDAAIESCRYSAVHRFYLSH
jgi:hypothetical protein